MPFIHDMLEETGRRRREEQLLAQESRMPVQEIRAHPDLESRYRFDVEAIGRHLRSEILGQDEAIDGVIRMLEIVRADIVDPRRPLHTGLLLGPTGVGKTELVRALARALHGDADALCRIDMNTLSQEHYAAAITGAPPGYVGSKEGHTLFDQEKIEGKLGIPGVVLFDEVEKASSEVVLALMNIFDNGALTVASGGRTYSFRNAIIFMTSNLGAERLKAEAEMKDAPWWKRLARAWRRKADASQIAQEALLRRFPVEFVNRIDQVEVFQWIDGKTVENILSLEIERFNRRLSKHGCRVDADHAWLASLAAEGFDRRFGARSLRRVIRQRLEAPFAAFLLESGCFPKDKGTRRFVAFLESSQTVFRAV